MTVYNNSMALAFFKLPQLYQSKEIKLLDEEARAFMEKKTVPHGEFAVVG
jgi:hypothetical protein